MMNQQNAAAPQTVSDPELQQVIADFLALGHVDTIVALFRHEPLYYGWTGILLNDERFTVRLGVSVLFEHLTALCPENNSLAIPGLIEQLNNPIDWVRGEAASVLGIIGTEEALAPLGPMATDHSPQVAEIVRDILGLPQHG